MAKMWKNKPWDQIFFNSVSSTKFLPMLTENVSVYAHIYIY